MNEMFALQFNFHLNSFQLILSQNHQTILYKIQSTVIWKIRETFNNLRPVQFLIETLLKKMSRDFWLIDVIRKPRLERENLFGPINAWKQETLFGRSQDYFLIIFSLNSDQKLKSFPFIYDWMILQISDDRVFSELGFRVSWELN
jgi:hypothetical protein